MSVWPAAKSSRSRKTGLSEPGIGPHRRLAIDQFLVDPVALFDAEVRLFKQRHPTRPVIPAILRGKPGVASDECFPPALKVEVEASGAPTDRPTELLAADFRVGRDGRDLARRPCTHFAQRVSACEYEMKARYATPTTIDPGLNPDAQTTW